MSLNRKSIVYRCLVALLCLVCMIVFTYSWFNRDNRAPESPGDRMLYSDNVNVNNSANLSMNTYLGTEQENGEIVYQSNPINVNETNVEGKQPGDKVHFKTKIINSGKRCKATLILKGFKSAQDIKFGVLKPMNTLKSYKSETVVELIRNVAVPGKEGNNDGYVEVDWYVCFDTETITLGYLYLFGN